MMHEFSRLGGCSGSIGNLDSPLTRVGGANGSGLLFIRADAKPSAGLPFRKVLGLVMFISTFVLSGPPTDVNVVVLEGGFSKPSNFKGGMDNAVTFLKEVFMDGRLSVCVSMCS
eukprot:Colp12_sorted_trinity150504_noHs@34763